MHGEEWATYDATLPPSRVNFAIRVGLVGFRVHRVVAAVRSRCTSSHRPRARAARRGAVLASPLLVPHRDRRAPLAAARGARAHGRRARRRDRHRPPASPRPRRQRGDRARVRAARRRDPRRGLGEDRRQRPARGRAAVTTRHSSPPCRGDHCSSAPSSTRSASGSGSSSSSCPASSWRRGAS